MASNYWTKIRHEVLDDPEISMLSMNHQFWYFKMYIYAGELHNNGHLPNEKKIHWRLRLTSSLDDFCEGLERLEKVGLLEHQQDGWLVVRFAEEQKPMDAAERMRRMRKRDRKKNYYNQTPMSAKGGGRTTSPAGDGSAEPVTKGNPDTTEDVSTRADEVTSIVTHPITEGNNDVTGGITYPVTKRNGNVTGGVTRPVTKRNTDIDKDLDKDIETKTKAKNFKVATKNDPLREKPPDRATDVVAGVVAGVVDDIDLPEGVKDQLALLGWADGYGEVKRLYGRDPNLVTAWLSHTLASDLPDGQAAGYFRNRLREGEMPPQKMTDHEKWTAKMRASNAKYDLSGYDDESEQLHQGGNGKTPHSPQDIPEEHQTVWKTALGKLQSEMPKAEFDTWVRDIQLLSTTEDTFTLATMNVFARDWLESRLKSTLTRFLTGAMGKNIQVNFVVKETMAKR